MFKLILLAFVVNSGGASMATHDVGVYPSLNACNKAAADMSLIKLSTPAEPGIAFICVAGGAKS